MKNEGIASKNRDKTLEPKTFRPEGLFRRSTFKHLYKNNKNKQTSMCAYVND